MLAEIFDAVARAFTFGTHTGASVLPFERLLDLFIILLFLPLETGAGVGAKVASKGIQPVGAAELPLLDMEKTFVLFLIIPFLLLVMTLARRRSTWSY